MDASKGPAADKQSSWNQYHVTVVKIAQTIISVEPSYRLHNN